MNVLAIGAHFDDIELGCGGTLARHVDIGDKVYSYVATLSGYVNTNNEVVRSNQVAHDEGLAAMNYLGIELICGDFCTHAVKFNEKLNNCIHAIILEKKIDLVYTHWVGDIHHDHQNVAKSSLHACRHVPKLLMYRSNWYHSTQEFRGTYYINISEYWHKKEEAIKKHVSELERTHYKWIDFFRREAENAGQRIGVPLAEVFEVVKWLEK